MDDGDEHRVRLGRLKGVGHLRRPAKSVLSVRAEAERAVGAVVDGIKAGLKKDRNVQLIGFGTFRVADRAARMLGAALPPLNGAYRWTDVPRPCVVENAGAAIEATQTTPRTKLAIHSAT